jgi:hypothetical protein
VSGPRDDVDAVPAWLTLRESADARARATELLDPLREHLHGLHRPLRIHDLGAGTGAAQRWLAPRLDGPQHWVLHDREPDRLLEATTRPAAHARDGTAVTVETRVGDVTALDLQDADLVTASALLDLLTAAEIDALATACAGRAVRWTLTVIGDVAIDPPDALDAAVAAAFDAHQRRDDRLGPGAAAAAVDALARSGAAVRSMPSPWRLGPDEPDLLEAWLDGRIDAAAQEWADLPLEAYRARRAEAGRAGSLRAVVGHRDVLALPW